MSSFPANPPASVLIVRLSAIGDVIHALPVLDALRRALPHARLGWIVEELSAPLLDNHPDLDKVYVIPKKRWKKNFRAHFRSEIKPFFAAVKADGWDVAIDMQGLSKSGLAAWASGAKIRVGYGDKDGREVNKLFTNRKVTPPPTARHVVERNLALLRGIGIEPPTDARGKLGITEDEREAIRVKLVEAGWNRSEPLAALNPGAGWSSKRWDPARFAEVGRRLHAERGLRPLILWGPGEEPLRDTIAAELERDSVPFVVSPPTRIRELAVLISLCSAFIGGDTGPTHLAGMLGVPTVSVFGASDGHRNRPWPIESATLVQREDIACVPCWKTQCPLAGDEYLKCLNGVSAENVANALLEFFNHEE